MVKKILSSIILIIIICSTYVYGANIIINENTNTSQEVTTPSNGNTTSGTETGNTNKNEDVNTDNNDKETEKEENKNEENKDEGNKNEESNNDSQIKEEDKKPTQDNSQKDEEDKNTDNKKEESNNDNQIKEEDKKPTQDNSQKDGKDNTNNNLVTTVKSSEARLKSLKIDVDGLTPDFDKNTTEYYLVVDLNVKQIKVTATKIDSKAKITILGNKNLKEGENTITISVKAEDGTTKKYYIHVTKTDNAELANAELESLEIKGFNLYPTFKSNIYSYNLNINKKVEELEMQAIPQREKAKIEIEGNENLEEGENVIKITVKAEDETTTRVYKINTYINSDRVEVKQESKTPAIILIVVLGICIIGLGIFIIIKNKR